MPPSRNIQYENAFRRGNAMSRAPIINGTRKLAKPARIGMTTRKIIVVPWNVITSLYEFFVRKCSFGVASCARISSAAMPPPPKNTSDVQMYIIPIRLWSSVTSQLATLPLFHVTGYAASDLAATRAGSLVDRGLRVLDERCHLRVRPAVADGGHLDPAVPHDVGDARGLGEQRVVREGRAVAALTLHPVAHGAGPLELCAPERARRGLARVRAEVGRARRDHARAHRLVVEAAELGALPVVRADSVGLEPAVIRLARDRLDLPAELRDPPAVHDVVRLDGEENDLVGRHIQVVDRAGSVRVVELPVVLM